MFFQQLRFPAKDVNINSVFIQSLMNAPQPTLNALTEKLFQANVNLAWLMMIVFTVATGPINFWRLVILKLWLDSNVQLKLLQTV